MKYSDLLAPWLRRFLLEHLIGERNLSRNTQHSYRDALSLTLRFLPFCLQPLSDDAVAFPLCTVSFSTYTQSRWPILP